MKYREKVYKGRLFIFYALEQTLFDDINRREGSTYSPNDYDKFPFLRSKMLTLLKKQFSEMF